MVTLTRSRPRGRRGAFGPVLLALVVPFASCAAPDEEPPEVPAIPEDAGYLTAREASETVSADTASGEAQRFTRERDLPAEWWTLFESPALDALVRRALDDSPRLAQARAKLVRAQEEFHARSGATKYPTVDVGATVLGVGIDSSATEEGTVADQLPVTLGFASVGVSYTLDLFDRNQRELEALAADVEYERFELEAARLMLAGNVVTTAIQEASLRRQLEAAEAVVALHARRLEIQERLEQLGGASKLDVVMQGAELAEARAALPALRRSLEQTRHRLTVYLGLPPGAAELPELRLGEDLHLPTELPLSLPSELARRRPDIRAAEALLHAASARVGVASADFYPRITLSARGGAVGLSDLLDGTAAFSLLSASVTQPLFRGGELKARKRVAEAAFEQAAAAYREVVLSALQEVADLLVALDADAALLRDRAEVAALARSAHEITLRQYEAGSVSLLQLLEAEHRSVSATIEETRAVRARFTDSAALFQALGGGWWNAEATDAAAVNGAGAQDG